MQSVRPLGAGIVPKPCPQSRQKGCLENGHKATRGDEKPREATVKTKGGSYTVVSLASAVRNGRRELSPLADAGEGRERARSRKCYRGAAGE